MRNSFEEITTYKKNLLQGTCIDIYGDDYTTEVNLSKYFVHLYNELCYTYSVESSIQVKDFLDDLFQNYACSEEDYLLKAETSDNEAIDKIDYQSSQYFLRLKDKLLIEIYNHRVTFYYGKEISFNEVQEIIKSIKKSEVKKKLSHKFYMIAANAHTEYGFDLEEFEIKKYDINIENNYNDDFLSVNNIVCDFLKEDNKNGLVLLHGKYGTGKTTYLRHLISIINRRFIYLPLNLMDSISSPNFLPFIAKYRDSVLILEDCEDLLLPRSSGNISNNSLVNLLNLGDGLLSDALSLKLICTFNAEIKRIDKAILRKGRLIARYEFLELNIEKSKAIAQINGIKRVIDSPLTLAEIYNGNEDDFSNLDSTRKVGFL